MEHRQSVEEAARLLGRARRTLAYGNLDSILRKPLCHAPGLLLPQFAARAEGYELEDTSGRVYIDWVAGGGGPLILGYAHPAVEAALRSQSTCAGSLSLMHPLEVEVAEALVEMVPCAERVAFGKNGSDVLTAAVRTARALTGREVILQYGMHGFHDWYVCHNPEVRGAPASLRPLIHPFPYNDLPALSALFERFPGEVAAVVMEPVREALPAPGYMRAVRDLTRSHGALLIYDEVVTALRLGHAGGMGFVGVEPDLACLGKSMGNGMPLSALVGRREVMEVVPGVAFGMTFRGETRSLAAAKAVLGVLRAEPVAEHLARIGEELRGAYHAACERHGLRSRLGGPPARMTFTFEDQGGYAWTELQALFVQRCLERGIFTNGNLLPCYAHDERAVARTVEVFDEVVVGLASDVQASAARPADAPRATAATGFLEAVVPEGDLLRISGWLLLTDRAPDAIEVHAPDGTRVVAECVPREDVAAANPGVARAARAGFSARIPSAAIATDDRRAFSLHALRAGELAFLCPVFLGDAPWPGPCWLGDGAIAT